MVYTAIDKSPIDTRRKLYANILTSGGSSMIPGFSTRLDYDMRKIYIENKLRLSKSKKIKLKIQIKDPPRRKYSVFMGASVYAKAFNNSNAE